MMINRKVFRLLVAAALCVVTLGAWSADKDPIRIAFLDPLSGAMSVTGYNALYQFEYAVDELVNKKGGLLGGRKMEVVPFDNQASPKETQIQLKRIIGEDIQFVFQGNSSAVANALTEAIDKHNRRNPDQRLLFLNYSAVDPVLTNEKCNFWHFRFDAHAEIKMNALTDLIAERKDIKKIYIIGQDYSFGKAVADAAVKYLTQKRPDIEIVGNELHPMEKVKDFTPYVTKIKSSGADAIITGNWGADMLGLAKAITDAGIEAPVYTYYGAYDGTSKALGESGVGRIRLIHVGHDNPANTEEFAEYRRGFKAKYPDHDLSNQRVHNSIFMLAKAIEQAGTTDPVKVAYALEGMRATSISGDALYMRESDHQLFQPLQISVHTNKGIEFDADNSGYGMLTEKSIPLENTITETTCEMKRPKDS